VSYLVYLRPDDKPSDSSLERDSDRLIGRVGAMECLEFGVPFADELTILKDVLEKEKILVYQVGYAFLGKAWGKEYATEATRALLEAFMDSRSFWNPPFKQVYWQTATGVANSRSQRVLEKLGFKLKGIHKWDAADVFIGGAMQPPEVCVFYLGPLPAVGSGYTDIKESQHFLNSQSVE
jgi:RimJ/RimL family protein N-acetyltransferase